MIIAASYEILRMPSNLGNGSEVMTVDGDHIPAVGKVSCAHILRHGEFGHLVEGHVIRVVHDDEIVELLVGREGGCLRTDTLL